MERYEFSAAKMGTEFRMIVYASDSAVVQQAVESAYLRIDNLNQVMSDYDPASEINRLADRAAQDSDRFYPVSDDLWEVLHLAKIIFRRSDGAFDITVGPLSKLWRRAFRRQAFPNLETIIQARSLVNSRWLKLRTRERSVRLKKAGMRLDLGGIAKGYAVDAAYKVLKEKDLQIALVDGGGDIYAGASPPGEPGWRVSKTALQGDSLVNEILILANGAIATSGDTYRFLEWEGKRYAHLIDPRSGLGMTDRRMVTVAAANCTLADALASTFSVVKLRKTKNIARHFDVRFEVTYQEDKSMWERLGIGF